VSEASSRPKRRIRTPLLQRLGDLSGGPLVLAIWLVAAAGAGYLFHGRLPRSHFVGLAHVAEFEVSTTIDGELAGLTVERYQAVEAGEVIAQLDSSELEAGVAAARARVSSAEAELLAAAERLRATARAADSDRKAELRRFEVDGVQLEIDLLSQRLELAAQRIEADRRAIYHRRLQNLAEDQVVTESDLDDARLRHEEVLARIEHGEVLQVALEHEVTAARGRRDAFASLPSARTEAEPVLQAQREGLRVEELQVVELELRLRHLMLRSPVSGLVSEVLARPGQALLAGESVVRIHSAVADSVVMYLPESDLRAVAVGEHVIVSRADQPHLEAESLVTRVSRKVEQLPPRLWLDAAVPEFGLAVLLAPPHSLELVPGELLSIRTLR
jgi:multidrug resistance efflux pump